MKKNDKVTFKPSPPPVGVVLSVREWEGLTLVKVRFANGNIVEHHESGFVLVEEATDGKYCT